jgi:hypothetical protein
LKVLRLLLLTCRSSRSKDLELLVLRQELAVLRRQVPHPKTRREERLVLTVLQRLRPVYERLSNLFTPDTLRRWHREFVRRKWDDPHPINKRKTIPLQGRSRLHLALLAGVDSLCAVLIDQDYTI